MGRYYTHICKTPYMPGQGIAPFFYSTYQHPTSEGYRPMESSIFISTKTSPEVAVLAMERLAERQFEMICKPSKVSYTLLNRDAIKINTGSMLNVWGRCRRDRECSGVFFWINTADKEVHGEAFY